MSVKVLEGPRAQDFRHSPEAGKCTEVDFALESPEELTALPTL